MAATVTVDQAHFEALLRRAEYHTSGEEDLTTPVNVSFVNIPKVDHDNLYVIFPIDERLPYLYGPPMVMKKAHNHDFSADSLREALYRGGIEEETLKTLIYAGQPSQGPLNNWVEDDDLTMQGNPFFSRRQIAKLSISRPQTDFVDGGDQWSPRGQSSGLAKSSRVDRRRHNSSAQEDDNDFTPDLEKEDCFLSTPRLERRHYERSEQRTIVARNLHERTTHKDITDFVRGGAVLDLYLRSNDKTASISFVEGQGALKFMNYVKRNDIYVHGKRLEWAWNDRQFILAGHVASKISIGATRNLVIHNISPNITEDKIREDLDHIHNLVIIDITFTNSDCHIAMNSIHNALFARTCLMSRLTYKGMRIESYEDECSQPLPEPKRVSKEDRPPPKKASQPMNRFEMLGTDQTDSEDGHDDPMTVGNMASLTGADAKNFTLR